MKSQALTFFVLSFATAACSGKVFGDPISGDPGAASSGSSGGTASSSGGATSSSGGASSSGLSSGGSTSGGASSGSTSGGTDTANVKVLASGQTPHAIATDGHDVYWVNADSVVGSVASVPVGGGEVRLIATNLSTADADQIALDADSIYFPVDGYVLHAPTNAPSPIVGFSPQYALAPAQTNAVAVDGTSVYWAEAGAQGIAIRSAPRAGGAATTLGSASAGQWRNALAVDDARVYVTPGAALIAEVAKSGGPTTSLAVRAESLAIDSSYVYFTNAGAGTVSKMPLAGGAPTVLATNQSGPWRIALDATSVYWGADQDGGSVMKVAKAGGAPVQLAKACGEPRAIAVDGANVYWADPAHGRILAVAK
jgi:hypothetical protein